MLATPVCPACHQATARRLEGASKSTVVNFYRCDLCAHLWTTTKDGLSIVQHVTPLPPVRQRPH